MLRHLSIRDLVVVESIELAFGAGLCALTGETGAGKSILIDGLGLALGRRAGADMIRAGAERATVEAVFSLAPGGPAAEWLAERGFDDGGGEAIVRRSVGADGRGRAFINDRPATVSALAAFGGRVLEIYGQHDRLGLLDPARHRAALDDFGGLEREAARVAEAHDRRRAAAAALAEATDAAATAAADREILQSQYDELAALAPAAGEEARLADERAGLMAGARVAEALAAAAAALTADPQAALAAAARAVHDAAPRAAGRLDELAAAFERAAIEAAEAEAALDAAAAGLEVDSGRVDAVEARLFALRAAARKHRVDVDRLPDVAETLAARLAVIRDGEDGVERLRAAARDAHAGYDRAAAGLTAGRRRAARALTRTIERELAALRLSQARFSVDLAPLDDGSRGARGAERVGFRVATNLGARAGALQRVASGGELSRFMLALCAALAGRHATPSLVFDEIDAGVGGAVAHAVGTRLARLAKSAQILVVTHHPQVAALAAHHYRIAKRTVGGRTATFAEPLPPAARREEIARMLSGAETTDEARAAADRLLAPTGAGRPQRRRSPNSTPTRRRRSSRAWRARSPVTTRSITRMTRPRSTMPPTTRCASGTRRSKPTSRRSNAPTAPPTASARRPREAFAGFAMRCPCCRSPTRSTRRTCASSPPASAASSILPPTLRWRSSPNRRSTASPPRCATKTACWSPG